MNWRKHKTSGGTKPSRQDQDAFLWFSCFAHFRRHPGGAALVSTWRTQNQKFVTQSYSFGYLSKSMLKMDTKSWINNKHIPKNT